MPYTTLISVDELLELMRQPQPPLLLDCDFDLMDPGAGERHHASGHIPGSVYVHLDRDLSAAKTGRNGRHPLPTREAFAATAGRWGLEPGRQVVAYDDQGLPYASRAWWMLRWLGHREVAVLDGGLAAWMARGLELSESSVPPQPRAPYPARDAAMPVLDTAAVQATLGRRRIVDARNAERFRGEVEPLDPVAGRIPGATHRFFKDNLGPDGRFRARDVLRAEFEAWATPAEQVVHQCGSGVTACHNLLAMEHAGLVGSALYPGSWSEWCADATRPVERG